MKRQLPTTTLLTRHGERVRPPRQWPVASGRYGEKKGKEKGNTEGRRKTLWTLDVGPLTVIPNGYTYNSTHLLPAAGPRINTILSRRIRIASDAQMETTSKEECAKGKSKRAWHGAQETMPMQQRWIHKSCHLEVEDIDEGGVCVRHGERTIDAALKDVRAPPTREEFVCGIEQTRNYAASRDAQINLKSVQKAQVKDSRKLCSIEGCTNKTCKGGLCMRHGAKEAWSKESTYNGRSVHETWSKGEPQCCVKLDVQINQGKEECAFGMVRRRNDAALRNAPSQIKTGAVCLRMREPCSKRRIVHKTLRINQYAEDRRMHKSLQRRRMEECAKGMEQHENALPMDVQIKGRNRKVRRTISWEMSEYL
eukprot:scaffold27971_cov83-Skeletonema_dohrnii-CCMP3373.AAC.4